MRNANFPVLIISVFLISCAAEPTIQTGPDAEVTFDGLTRVDNSVLSNVWVKAGVDLSAYSKVMFQKAGVEFREVSGPESGSTTGGRRPSGNEFPLSEADQERLVETIGAAFRSEMERSDRFEVVDEPGPDVLLVRGGLLDVVSRVPPTPTGRSTIWLDSVGEATLVFEVRSSQSKAIFARAVDRRAAQRAGGQGFQANSVTTWAEVRRLANTWATRLRTGLESL